MQAPGSSDSERPGSASEPIVGGTVTSARPEVGQFLRDRGTVEVNCSATLIAPNAVITAGHCIDAADESDTRDVQVLPRDRWVPGTGGPSFPVSRLVSFGKNAGDGVPNHGLFTDVLLLLLSGAVPSSVAVPAKLARTYPNQGDPATIIGFGCTDRSSAWNCAGGGTKRFEEFSYGSENSVSFGDSGGPLLFGHLADQGALFAVVSGFASNIFSSWDVYGDAAWAATQIEPLIRGADPNGFERDMDRPGLDYWSFAISDPAVCQTSCGNDPLNCHAWTWVPPSFWGTPTCFLKRATPDRTPNPGVISGLNPRGVVVPLERNVDRPGSDYNHFNSSDVGCQDSCARDWNCRAFSWVATNATYDQGVCWLKNAVPSPVGVSSDIRSAIKAGLEMDTDRPGSDYDNFDIDPFPESCQSQCRNDGRCAAWTYTRPTPSANAHCWLKSSAPNPLPGRTDIISGLSQLEFR
jgi:hypothetical protein